MKIVIINGPNLNLLGTREPEIYGHETLDDIINGLKTKYPDVEFVSLQSNVEGEIINMLHEYGFSADGNTKCRWIYSHLCVNSRCRCRDKNSRCRSTLV